MKSQLAAPLLLMLSFSGCGNHWVLRKDAPKHPESARFESAKPKERTDPFEERRVVGDVLIVEKRDGGQGMADFINATTVIVAKDAERRRVQSLLSAVFPDVMGDPPEKPRFDLLLPRTLRVGGVDAPRVKTVDEYLADLRMGFAGNKAAYEAAHPGAVYAWNDDFDYAAERLRLLSLLKGQRAVILRYVHAQTAQRGR